MRILVLCDEGNNRSVTLAGQLKYLGHDVLTAGLRRNSPSTLSILVDWSTLVIFTAHDQLETYKGIFFPICWSGTLPTHEVWDIGPDIYPRPYNKELLAIVKKHIKEHEPQ